METAGTLEIMDWPHQSLDLNPIEQIWGELENKLDRSIDAFKGKPLASVAQSMVTLVLKF